MNSRKKLRIFNAVLTIAPLGFVLNFWMGIGLVLVNDEKWMESVYTFFNHSKIVLFAYFVSESVLYLSKDKEIYRSYTQYLAFLPLIIAIYGLWLMKWDYVFILLYLIFWGFIGNPIAWCIYAVLYLFYRLLKNNKADEKSNNERK